MAKSLEEIATEALSLPLEERAVLAYRILASLESSEDNEKLWLEEAKCRENGGGQTHCKKLQATEKL